MLSDQRVAVVTGGAGGIGLAVVRRLSKDGYRPVILDVERAACDVAASALARDGAAAEVHVLDVRRKAEVQDAFRQVLAQLGRIDALVCLAGGSLRYHLIQDFPLSEWQEVVDVNLKGTFLCCQAAIPAMKRSGSGAIVNTSSNLAVTGSVTRTPYSASKAAIVAFTKSLSLELAPFGIRANCIAPGRTSTARVRGHSTDEEWAMRTRDIPMGRAAEPEEIAEGVAFLVSDEAAYITGQTLHVNGGLVLP